MQISGKKRAGVEKVEGRRNGGMLLRTGGRSKQRPYGPSRAELLRIGGLVGC